MNYLYKIDKLNITEASRPIHVPRTKHYAVIVYESNSVYIEGDERSKTNPGHGYPAHTETFNSFKHYVTQNKSDWIKLIEALENDPDNKLLYVAFEVNKVAQVHTKVEIE